MCHINKTLRIVLGLSFLPGRLRNWLFSTGSRLWEVFNIILLLIFGLTVFTDSGAMFNQPAYRAFVGIGGHMADEVLGISCMLMAGAATVGLGSTSFRARRLAGFTQLLSWALWWLMAAGFWASYPPLSTGQATYPIVGLFCALVGFHIMYGCDEAQKGRVA